MAEGLEGEVAGGDGRSTGHGRGLYSRTVRPAARIDAWTQSPCCSAESDGTSAKKHKHRSQKSHYSQIYEYALC